MIKPHHINNLTHQRGFRSHTYYLTAWLGYKNVDKLRTSRKFNLDLFGRMRTSIRDGLAPVWGEE